MHAGHSYPEWDHCYPNCTPMTMTVHPPPLTVSIMSPAHYSPGHPACIKPHDPCAPAHCWDGRSHYGHYHGLAHGAAPCSTSTSQKCLPRRKGVPCHIYWAQEPSTADWEGPTTSITSRNVWNQWDDGAVIQPCTVKEDSSSTCPCLLGIHPQRHV